MSRGCVLYVGSLCEGGHLLIQFVGARYIS